tara:strand:+ start:1404 stop:2474 length:1071 start_codon:yes stop_codon:yes gene_type:complete
MFTSAFTTITPFEVVLLSKYNMAIRAFVKVFGIQFIVVEQCSHIANFIQQIYNNHLVYCLVFSAVKQPLIQEIKSTLLSDKKLRVLVQREDLIHPHVSGNKWRKLKYNLLKAQQEGCAKVLTFGGAFSNHIIATAVAAAEMKMQSVGLIRGEEFLPLNPTLVQAKAFGMSFQYLDREIYREKSIVYWANKFPDCYIIPEGGTNVLAVKGCEEIIQNQDFDVVCCACGTGGTIAGIINSIKPQQKAIGFPVLKGADFLRDDIQQYVKNVNWEFCMDYHFGGYAKVNKNLIDFMNTFKKTHGIPLDPVYTGKLFYGVFDLIAKDYFREGATILLIHTGGLQGIAGMNQRIEKKGWRID